MSFVGSYQNFVFATMELGSIEQTQKKVGHVVADSSLSLLLLFVFLQRQGLN